MSAEMSGEQMQAKIAAARRDAEGLKDKIKRKKDELADTSRKIRIIPAGQALHFVSGTKSRRRSMMTLANECIRQQYVEWPRVIPMPYHELA